jgi:hypothetical protein
LTIRRTRSKTDVFAADSRSGHVERNEKENVMKRKFATTKLSIALLTLFALGTVAANAQCSAGGVAGKYGYTATGTIVGLGPASSVGAFRLDTAGNITGEQTRSFNGLLANETLAGTATVTPGCRGTATINVFQSGVLVRTTHMSLAYVNDQKEILAIFLTAGTVITIDAKKTF